jgi:hypothetical protein
MLDSRGAFEGLPDSVAEAEEVVAIAKRTAQGRNDKITWKITKITWKVTKITWKITKITWKITKITWKITWKITKIGLGYILGYFSQTHASFRFKTVEKG